jgi:Tripartite tricarboxylate transporter TctB family
VVATKRLQARNLKMAQDEPKSERVAESAPSEGPASVLIAAGLLVLSACFAIGGLEIRVPEGWQTAPGMLPIILGVSLFIMSGLLLVKAIRAGALRVRLIHEMGESSLTRAGIALLLVGIYYFVLLEFLPFEVASSLYLLAMFWTFWPEGGLVPRLATAIGLPIAITLCFQGVFQIPLPGEGNLILLGQYLLLSH